MRTIAACFSGRYFFDPPLDTEYWRMAYTDLGTALEKAGAEFWIVRHTDDYAGGNRFTRGWRFSRGVFLEERHEITVDVILDKSRDFQPTGDTVTVNRPDVRTLCENKMEIIRRLPKLCPASHLVKRLQEVQPAIGSISSNLVVAKTPTGSGGEGVIIDDHENITARIQNYPVIIQEFLDTSHGIPGIVDTHHDFRMIITGGEVALTFTRSPSKGKLLSNTSQGGYMIIVPPELRPAGALALVPAVDRFLEHIPTRYYSIDCARLPDGSWKIIELNDQPGIMTRYAGGDEADRFFEHFTSLLLSA